MDITTSVDISQFAHVTIRCNRKSMLQPHSYTSVDNEKCPKTLNLPFKPKRNHSDNSRGSDTDPPTVSAVLGNVISALQLPYFLVQYYF